ncbi:Hypothetical protein SMAX5B_015657 [Scophthalmus maximus]|uniref:G-protein coupled receptors family 1 profile domain-containing protein n=1 Tax=Scophthalmus maximus TaxID=52904 RepID=A0A2U9CXJ1_SCOMX|nr:Hypothetical protein SMAX5B_015657 [Scophthalmus maximus]KAF0024313.1 hypothetical protein F2P81_023115 [Scophthalmus maximus]
MEGSIGNVSLNSSKRPDCQCESGHREFLSLVDVVTFLVGQPVVARLLWVSLTSNRTPDVLNCNLAVFHNVQYWISAVHLFILFMLPREQQNLFRFLLVFAQTGGPMNLCYICMQRYVAVIHPTSYPLLKKYRYAEVCAATVWLLSVPLAFANTLAPVFISPLIDQVVDNLPFFLMVCMCLMMVRSSVKMARALLKPGPEGNRLSPAKRRACRAIRATSAVTMMFYVPVNVLQKVTAQDPCTLGCVVTPGCVLLLSAASIVHPLFYLSTHGKLFACRERERKASR